MRPALPAAALLLALAAPAHAQNPFVSFGGAYAQNFDALRQNNAGQVPIPGILNRVDAQPFTASAAGELTGWRWRQSGTATAFSRGDGSAAAGQGYSFGNAFNDGEAALGNLTGSANPSTYFGVILRNNTGAALSSVTISYTGEQWRSGGRGDGTADRLAFGYALNSNELPGTSATTGVPALDFTSPVTAGAAGVLDGNAAPNRTLVTSVLSFGPAATWLPGTDLALRWSDDDILGVDDAMAIDNFMIVVQPVPEPATVLGTAAGALALGRLARRRRGAAG